MADPLSVASGVAGLVSLTIQATQLACKYVAEVSHAGETALQCLRSLSLLRDVLEKVHESEQNEAVASIIKRKSDLISSDELQKCTQSVERICQQLQALFHDDGKVKRRKALIWPFQSSESANLIKQLQDFRDNLASVTAADSLEVSAKSYVVVSETQKDVQAIKTNLQSALQDEQARKCLAWIDPDDTEQWRFGSHTTAPVGDGRFLFDSTEFQSWLNSPDGMLWTYGSPGSGKSVLMSQAISYLQLPRQSSPIVLSHFCDHRNPRIQSPELIMRHLIKQAALQSASVLQEVQACPEYLNSRRSGRSPRELEVQRMLLEVCLAKEQCVVIIDGLDECSEEVDGSDARQNIMKFLTVAASHNARVLVASRDLADIHATLGRHPKCEVRAPDADMRAYVATRLAGLGKRMPSAASLKPTIVDKIVADADGIFLLARLTLDILAPTSIKNLRQIKNFLNEKCLDLSEMYQAAYARIQSSDTANAELARKLLSWICLAQRPLHEIELQHAIATELEDEDFDPDGITPGDILRSSCMGLVASDDKGVYSFFHLTAYEFFRSHSDISSTASHLLISRTCLTYLSFTSTGRRGPCEDLEALEFRKSGFRFFDYAAKHGVDHFRKVEEHLVDEIMLFLGDDTLRRALMQAFYHHHRDDEELRRVTFESLPSGSSPLHVASGRGLVLTAKRLLQKGADIKEPDHQGWTPLIAATSYGQLAIVDLLLSHLGSFGGPDNIGLDSSCGDDADARKGDTVGLNQPDNDGWTPLFWAIIKNQYEAAELLLTAGSSISVQDKAGWTPIEWAAFRADRAFVDLILRSTQSARVRWPGPRLPTEYPEGEFSPLFLAAAAGDYKSVEAMLDFVAQAPASTEQNLESLFKVLSKRDIIYERHYRLERGSTVMPSLIAIDNFSIKLLESAIRSNQPTMVKMLVELGASLGAIKSEAKKRSPLHIAACCGHHNICEYLLLKGSSPTLQDTDGYTAMDLAIKIGHPHCTRLFLTLSPPPSTLVELGVALSTFVLGLRDAGSGKLKSSPTPSKSKVRRDPRLPEAAMSMLDIQGPNDRRMRSDLPKKDTAFKNFRFEEIADVLQALLGYSCDLAATDECWDARTRNFERPLELHQACSIGNPDLISFLITNGAEVNRRDINGRSPLHTACDCHGTPIETIQLLLRNGADANALDEHDYSPLYDACRSASIEVVRYLVANGAMVKVYGKNNDHPLHDACRRRSYAHDIPADTMEVIKYILSQSDPDFLSVESLSRDETSLDLAVGAGNWEAVEYLHRRGAKVKDFSSLTYKLWQYAWKARERPFQLLLGLEASPAHKCSEFQNKTIIAHSLDQYLQNKQGADEGFEYNLQALIQAGADINAYSSYSYFDSEENKGVTVLRRARNIGVGDDFVQILLRHGATEGGESGSE